MNQNKYKLIYLASPYTSESKEEQKRRVQDAEVFTHKALLRGWTIFSPIVYSASLAKYEGMPGNWDFWKNLDLEMLSRSDELWVLMLTGWTESVGVQAEITEAKQLEIPVRYFELHHCP